MSVVADSLHFAFAGPADDTALRRLLRYTPLHGLIDLSFAHEPDYFLGATAGLAEDRTLTAWQHGRLVAAGRCRIQPRWLNGTVHRCAYLGELRLAADVQGRSDILRRGYAFFSAEYARDPADFCFTSIVSDNRRARRVLERGVRGLPRYELIAGYTTLLLRARRYRPPALPAGLEWTTGDTVPVDQLVALLNASARGRHLAAHWTAPYLTGLASLGLGPRDFLLVRAAGALVGGVAVWDQRSFRQIIIERYHPALAAIRPLANITGAVFGWPRLPPVGATLAHAYLSPLVVEPDYAHLVPYLIRAGVNEAAQRGLDGVALGFADDDPLGTKIIPVLKGRRYPSRLYAVHWQGVTPGVSGLDARPCAPELALL